MNTRVLLLGLFGLALVSCTHKENIKEKVNVKTTDITDYKINPLMNPGMESFEWGIPNEWGLALSGGGLRAALYSVGVLKALEQAGALKDINIVSSVSGGGYAAYWLFSDPQLNQVGFGGRLSAEKFPISMCQLLTSGNFVTNAAAVTHIFRSSANYEKSLYRTFGPNYEQNALELGTSIDKSGFKIELSHKIPYHIVNTTDDVDLPWKFKMFEFTPLGYGNYVLPNSMTTWKSLNGIENQADETEVINSMHDNGEYEKSKVAYIKTIAISGAAVNLLSQILSFKKDGEIDAHMLSDGGNSENLGAYALIRRGVKNIIIVDAEHNPYYEFTAYKNLKLQLADDGYEFSVPEIDEFVNYQPIYAELDKKLFKHRLFNSAFTGYVKNKKLSNQIDSGREPYSAKIYYIKMANSRTTDLFVRNIDKNAFNEGRRVNNEVYEHLINEAEKKGLDKWDCNSVTTSSVQALGEKDALENWFKYVLSSYTEAFPGFFSVKLLNLIPNKYLKSDFPQYTTVDQSYYHDQAIAFMALGYFSTLELRPEIIKDLNNRQ